MRDGFNWMVLVVALFNYALGYWVGVKNERTK